MAAGVLLELGGERTVEEAQKTILRYRDSAHIQEEARNVLRHLYET
ncbi:hypothetical protein [Alkalicoccus halolimnae]|uniref:Uncharacterized protein n=1 Tax=Alkalicoccus halolimnae TaxID=1667239 RepID=A0AAJ8LVF1_9BACI|nr:hypothetical protein [Alkalicoccus halolimnae]